MKRYSVSLVFIMLLFSPLNNDKEKLKPNKKPEGTGRWSGTVKFVETVNISKEAYTARSERQIIARFNDALPTLYRNDETTDLNFTDDKGTGSHTYHSEGRFIGRPLCITDCQSSDKAQLHAVVIREEDNEYDIEIISPTCIGTTCAEDGSPAPYEMSQSVIVSSHPLGGNKNILSGTITKSGEVPGDIGVTYTSTTTWHLVRSNNNDELIITPDNYDTWLPEPGRDELSKGSEMKISLKVFGINGQPPTLKAKSFEVKLNNTSREPGITLNYPLVPGSQQLHDIRILPQTNVAIGNGFQSASVKCNNGYSGEFSIASFDGGGFTTLTATAIMEDNSRLEGHLLISGGVTEVLIPKREAGTNIAVAWLTANNNPGETDDKETSNGNSNNGDGLSAYEEYRGVLSEGIFKRLDPKKKEVGVKMKRTEIPLFTDGIAKFENASDIKVIRFIESEISADRKLNKNFSTAHVYDQYSLFLQKGALTGDLGKSFGGPAIPMQVSKTVIDQNRIRLSYQDRLAEANSMNVSLSYTEQDLFATVTAHEMSHSVNVQHHGSAPTNSLNLQIPEGRPVHIYNYNRIEITQRPYTITGRGGDVGNEQSGDINCFMLNNALYDWSVKINSVPWLFYQVPLIPLGTKLCNSKNGTGLNSMKDADNNFIYFGDATFGNCLNQIKLRD